MLSEMKVENCLEIRHSTFDKDKQYNFLLFIIFNDINVEVGVDFFPEILGHQCKVDAYSIDSTKIKFVADKIFLVSHKICSLSVPPDILIMIINNANLTSYSK